MGGQKKVCGENKYGAGMKGSVKIEERTMEVVEVGWYVKIVVKKGKNSMPSTLLTEI